MIDRRSALAMLLGCAASAAAQDTRRPAAPRHVLPFDLYDNRIYLEVATPSEVVGDFILDTGAQVTHYTAEFVARAGLATAGSIGISGTGAGRVAGVRVAPLALRIGDLSLPVGRGVAAPADALFGEVYRGTGRRFDGILGHDLFAAHAVEIDYAARALRLHPPGTQLPAGAAIPIRLIDRKPYLEAALVLRDGVLPALLHVDTGFGGVLSLNARFVAAQRLLDRAGPLLPTWLRGVGGITEGRLARLDAVRLGSVELAGPITGLALVQGAGVRAEAAGRVGGELLRRFTVGLDYASRTLSLAANRSLAEPFETDMSGLSLIAEDEAIRVWHVAAGTPAAAAGVRENDRIEAIDGVPTVSLDLERVRLRLRGDGEDRRLRLSRDGAVVEAMLRLRRRL